MISVFIAGDPAPQGSKRFLGNGIMIEASAKVKPWRADVRAALTREDGTPRYRFEGPVKVEMVFRLRRPKSAPKKRYIFAAKKPDLDKLDRAVLDAIKSAGVFGDDSQVVAKPSFKIVGWPDDTPGLFLRITACSDVEALELLFEIRDAIEVEETK